MIDQLELDMTPDTLLGDVAFASDNLRRTVQISVEHTNPSVASDIAIAWGNLLIQDQQIHKNSRHRIIIHIRRRRIPCKQILSGAVGKIVGPAMAAQTDPGVE